MEIVIYAKIGGTSQELGVGNLLWLIASKEIYYFSLTESDVTSRTEPFN